MSLVYFLIVVGPLVFFHELGHYLAARRFGVACLVFSVGVGPRIASFRRWDTDFVIGALPLGGYVRLLGADPGDVPGPEEEGASLDDKPVWQRAIISLAGPLANILLAIPLFMFVAGTGTHVPDTVLGFVSDGAPAAEAGLQAGDRVIAIDGRRVAHFPQMQRVINRAAGEPIELLIERDGVEQTVTVTPEAVRTRDEFTGMRVVEVGQIGVSVNRYGPVIHTRRGTPAWDAGLRPFDEISRVGDVEIESFHHLERVLGDAAAGTSMLVVRPEPTAVPWAMVSVETQLELYRPPGADLDALGIGTAQNAVYGVVPGTPADSAGLRPGDLVTAVDGRPISDLQWAVTRMRAEDPGARSLTVVRDGQTIDLSIEPQHRSVHADLRAEIDVVFVGIVTVDAAWRPSRIVRLSAGQRIGEALVGGIRETVGVVVSLVLGVFLLIIGQVDTSNLGGPMMIFDIASRAGSAGLVPLLNMMALISVNLAIINLVPVPGLDGGHLVLYAIEAVRRRPLSARARQIASYVGFVSIVLLMLFVFKNDVQRYWETFANWLDS